MAKITFYGASDDLMTVKGDINDEFTPNQDDEEIGDLIAISDGTVLRVRYGDGWGCWRIELVATGTAKMTHTPGVEYDDTNDSLTLEGDAIRWVVCNRHIAFLPKKSIKD